MPCALDISGMAESPENRGPGVLLFGGRGMYDDRILELHSGASTWNTLKVTLKNGRSQHVVIPLQ